MSNIALIGPSLVVDPLAASGIKVFGCDTGARARATLENIASEYPLIFMTEGLALECRDLIECLEVTILPDHKGSSGLFKEKIDKLIRSATGAASL